MEMKFPNGHEPRYENFTLDGYIDETLREGAERCLFAINDENKYNLVKQLSNSGVRDIIIGSGPQDPDLLLKCLKAKHELNQFPSDLKFAFILLLNSWEPIYNEFKKYPQEYMDDVIISFGMIEIDKENKLLEKVVEKFIELGFNNFRASLLNNFSHGIDEEKYMGIVQQIDRCTNLGFATIRINDSLGTIYPEAMSILAANLRHDYPNLNFCLHAHNDRGLGLQNALASVYHGFNMIEGAVAGYGNRSGLPALETLNMIFNEKKIKIKNTFLDHERLLEMAVKTDETFFTVPNIYRPDSGLIVNKENLGVLNIPDYLEVERETDYFLNKVGLHIDTIKKVLRGAGFHDSLTEDKYFISEIQELLGSKMNSIAGEKEKMFSKILTDIHNFYSSSVMTAEDVVNMAEERALVK